MPDPKIQFIIDNLQENLEVEAKNWLNGLADNGSKATLAKEIIALANHGGGYVFIGFDDGGAELTEMEPEAGQLEAFTQDAVAGLVQRYVSPPCQCRVEFASKNGSDIRHPVIVVPGNHRTPLFAARGGPDDEMISGRVYVRRPGGSSEEARTQDDWEKLIERLVKARQSEMLHSFREVLDPSSRVLEPEQSSLEDWQAENVTLWREIVDRFDEDDPRRLASGFWTVSFAIAPFNTPSLAALNTALDRDMPKHSGWPPFTYLHRDPVRPRAQGDLITAYIGGLQDGEVPANRTDHADYWRVSRDGKGFLLRPMQEDRAGYLGNVHPRPEGPFFDWVLPVYRATEVLKFIEALAGQFGGEEPSFQLLLTYHNTQNRQLTQHDHRYNLWDGAVCHAEQIENRIEAPVADIEGNLEELVHSLLTPVYEQFDFTELPRALVTNVVADALGFRI